MLKTRLAASWVMACLAITLPWSIRAEANLSPSRVHHPGKPSLEQDRKRLIAMNLSLTEEEAKAFWPLYERFAADLSKWRERRQQHIGLLGENFDNLSEKEARQFIEERLALDEQRLRILRQHYQRLNGKLSARKLATYFQIEAKIHAYVETGIAEHIPLLDETAPATADD